MAEKPDADPANLEKKNEQGSDAQIDATLGEQPKSETTAGEQAESEATAEEQAEFEKIVDEQDPEFKNLLQGIEAEKISAISEIEEEPSTFVKIKIIALKLLKKLVGVLRRQYQKFQSLSMRFKMGFIFGVLAISAATYFIHRYLIQYEKSMLEDKMFITNLEKLSDSGFQLEEEENFEPYYDSPRAQPNVLLLPKVVVNIKPSGDSSNNPMAAFEIYVEAFSPEALIEMKEREIFFRDALQRSAEEANFDDFANVDRRTLLMEKFRKDLNGLLTQGEIKGVRFKTIIFKP